MVARSLNNLIRMTPLRAALFIIDVQDHLCDNLVAERRTEFPRQVRAAADHLRKANGVPAVVIALGRGERNNPLETYACEAHNPSAENMALRKKKIAEYNLGRLGVHATEAIGVKYDNSVFHGNHMAQQMKLGGTETLLLAGMYSSLCVADTARDAIKAGIHCVVFTDLLADASPGVDSSGRELHENEHKGNPAWHKAAVRRHLPHDIAAKITFTTFRDFVLHPQAYLAGTMPQGRIIAPAKNRPGRATGMLRSA